MLYKEFEKNREDILENEFCMQSDARVFRLGCRAAVHILKRHFRRCAAGRKGARRGGGWRLPFPFRLTVRMLPALLGLAFQYAFRKLVCHEYAPLNAV